MINDQTAPAPIVVTDKRQEKRITQREEVFRLFTQEGITTPTKISHRMKISTSAICTHLRNLRELGRIPPSERPQKRSPRREERREFIDDLFKIGLSGFTIARGLRMKKSTVMNDWRVSTENTDEDAHEERSTSVVFMQLISAYAGLYLKKNVTPEEFSERDEHIFLILRESLAIGRIEDSIRGVTWMLRHLYTPDDSLAYRDLLYDVFFITKPVIPELSEFSQCVDEYWYAIARGERFTPSSWHRCEDEIRSLVFTKLATTECSTIPLWPPDAVEHIKKALKDLPHKLRIVLQLRYGLEGVVIHTFDEIRPYMETSRARVQQLEQAALRSLRKCAPYLRQLVEPRDRMMSSAITGLGDVKPIHPPVPIETDLSTLKGFPKKGISTLHELGIHTIENLLQYTYANLLKMKRMGEVTADRIQYTMQCHGHPLRYR